MYAFDSHSSFTHPAAANSYIYEIIPLGSGVAVTASDDSLYLLDPTDLARKVSSIDNVNKEVTCLKSLGDESTPMIVTAGRDGRINVWDARASERIGEMRTEKNQPILSLATSTPGFSIAAGTELQSSQAAVAIWDTRFMAAPRLQYVESHSDDITELQYHPLHHNVLLSGSTDGLVNLYNTTFEDEDDALHQTLNHGASIHHSGFLTETDIFALSHDEKFSTCQMVTNFEETVEEPPPHDFGDLRDLLGCEYVANVLARPGSGGVIGIGSHSKGDFALVQLRKDNPWTFVQESTVQLHEAHGSEIVRTFCFLDKYRMILTGGEDGLVKAWKSA